MENQSSYPLDIKRISPYAVALEVNGVANAIQAVVGKLVRDLFGGGGAKPPFMINTGKRGRASMTL